MSEGVRSEDRETNEFFFVFVLVPENGSNACLSE